MSEMYTRSAKFNTNSLNEENRTVNLVWSTGAKVLRKNWDSVPVYEELEMSDDAVDLSFLNDKAPLLVDHNSSSVRNIVGVIEIGSAKIHSSEGFATVRFGTDPSSHEVFQKLKDGLISKVSVGYSVQKIRRIKPQRNDDYDTIKVTKWTPKEVSLVVFPADKFAGIRSEEVTENERNIKDIISEENQKKTEKNVYKNDSIDEEIEQAKRSERKRISELRKMAQISSIESNVIESLIDQGTSVDEARKIVLNELEKRSLSQTTRIEVCSSDDSKSRTDDLTNALLNRFDPQIELKGRSERFRNVSLIDAARIACKINDHMTKPEIVERALSTTDFPYLLANVFNKTLRREYEQAPRTFDPLVRKVSVPDFRIQTRVQIGDAPVLLEKSEYGQYQQGNFSEAKESYSLREWGRKIVISRQMLINDDLSAMLRLPGMFARRASELEGDLAWNAILKNPLMGDDLNLFSEKHGNYLKAGSKISTESVAAAKNTMRMQKGLNGSRLNITPKYLIVPAALESAALQFLYPTTPNTDAQANPYKNALTLIVEPRLDDVSATAWYLSADLPQIDLIELAYLQGREGLYVEQKIDFDSDGIHLKVRLDCESKAIDHRGFYKNEGAK